MSKKLIKLYKFVPGNVIPTTNLYPNASALLYSNRKYIIEETIAFIQYNVTNNIAPFAYYTYNAEKCRRDISYIVDGYISDLKTGSNQVTCFNASQYFIYGIPQVDGNRLPEVSAHTFIQNLVLQYILTNTTYSGRQVIKTQVKDFGNAAEAPSLTAFTTLSNVIINVITNGLSSLPAVINTRGYVKFPGFYKRKDILLITNTTQNVILYNFADPSNQIDETYSEQYDSDFPGALYGEEKITKITFDIDTSDMLVTDQIQIFVEAKEQAVRLNPIATDAMERMKVGIPQSMLDADFEYGLQPTKWQTISMMRNYPSVYEIPGSDTPVVSVTTDASSGTGSIGASLMTVTTQANHGFVAGNVMTIKALASSIKGFDRAEGTFIVNSVPTLTSLTYYAKSRVGSSSGQQLASTYTQLRKAGYYTGASVGTPSFTVYSNGQSGTISSSLTTATGSYVIGFTGTAPITGSPITVTGVPTGTQITQVVGTGGVVTTTQLTSSASIGDTSIIVTDPSAVAVGLVINRGDGTSIAVTNVQGNTVGLSGPLTSTILGTNQTYTNAPSTPVTGQGTGATFNVSRLGLAYNVSVGNNNGQGYNAGDIIRVLGTSVGGATPANDVSISINSASPLNQPATLDPASLNQGSLGYSTASNVSTTGSATGTGLTVDITCDDMGIITDVAINVPGNGYVVGDVITFTGGNNNDASINILTVNAGGDIISFTTTGTAVTAPSVNFISGITISDFTTSSISGSTSISYTSIATIQIQFINPHGFVPGDSLTVQITSTDTNAQLAAGAFFVEQIPTPTTVLYTARSQGTITNTLQGIVYARPDSYYVHRPYDGGVQLGTGGPAHGATAIRMSKKYIRYQSGKGIMYNTGALFAPSYDVASVTAVGTSVGSSITITTDDTDHGCQVGSQIKLLGVTTAGYNGVYTVVSIIDERSLTVQATSTLASTTVVLSSPCQISTYQWHGATVRSGTFDDQNGMFWQYDGIRMAVGRRTSTNRLAGTINIAANDNNVYGTGTRFGQQLIVGDRIVIKGMTHIVSSITSDTLMSVTPDYRGVSNVVGGKANKVIDFIIPQENWNLDPCNGTGPSGYNIDVTKMQMIGMQWTWYGAGFIDFMLRGPQGDYVFVHRFRNSNVNTEAYMRSGNQPVRYEVINEGARGRLTAAMTSNQTTISLSDTDAYWFPNSGVVMIENELIRFTGNSGTSLTGCTRASKLTEFVAGSNRSFSAGPATTHASGQGVVLVSNTITPIISHWGSAFMIDGQFDSDRGYLFNYASTGITASLAKTTAFLIRLAPSVSNAQTGDLGDRELLNRAQLLLQGIEITADTVSGGGGIVIEGVLNPSNYPTDPTNITWSALNTAAAGGQPSFAQVAPGGSVTWSGNFSQPTASIQGAFTTTISAKALAPSTSSFNAVGFSAVSQTIGAYSFGYANQGISVLGFAAGQPITSYANTTMTAMGFAAGQPYGNNTYVNAVNSTRNDFLITNTQYDGFTTLPVAGDSISGPNIAANTYIVSVTRAYLSGVYTRIVMSNNGLTTTTAGVSALVNLNITSRYTSATNQYRTDILIANTAWSALSPVPQVGDAISGTNIGANTTISSVTTSYQGTAYTRIVLNQTPTATSTAGSGNNVSMSISTIYSATYNSALSTGRNDFLITQASYAALTTPISTGDTLAATTYIVSNQTVNSVTPNYITIGGVAYARVIMSAVASATSTAAATNGANNITVTVTSSIAATYNTAISSSRSTFLITQADYTTNSGSLRVTDVLSATTYITGSQTVSAIVSNYTTIQGVAYAQITMSGNGNATSTAGTGNNVAITDTSSITATYASAVSTSRNDILVLDSDWTASGIAQGDVLSLSTYITGSQTISSVQTGYLNLGGNSYTRIVMSSVGNATSTSQQNQTVTVRANGTASSYTGTNYLFFDSTSWLASNATIGTAVATTYTAFPAGTSVLGVSSRTFGATTIYRVQFTQSSNTTVNAAATVTFQFGAAYALPGEQVFSFISLPGTQGALDLSNLKELTSTAIGGRGTFPNGPDVLAINVYKTSGTNAPCNLIIRWGEAQA